MQTLLVALQTEHVIASLPDNLASRLFLTVHGVRADDAACHVQLPEQLWHCGNLVALTVDLALGEHQSALMRPGADHVNGRLDVAMLKAVPKRLAIDSDLLFRNLLLTGSLLKRRTDGLRPRKETGAERFRVQLGEHSRERVVRWNAVGKRQSLFEPLLLRAPEQLDLNEVIRTAEYGAERD